MTRDHPYRAALILLALLAGQREKTCDVPWDEVMALAKRNRCLPMLAYQMQGQTGDVPPHIRDRLRQARDRAAYRALAQQAEIVGAHRKLSAVGVPHLFLKGAFLGQFAYPAAGLRPMRDIDILVPGGAGAVAWMALSADKDAVVPAQMPKRAKHMPHVPRAPEATVVEIHMRIADLGFVKAERPEDLEHTDLSARSITRPLGGADIRFPGPTDQLLHLCVHAACEHRFDIGPLILSDIRYLLATETVDWAALAKAADGMGALRSVALSLALAKRYGGCALPDLPDNIDRNRPDDRIVDAAVRAMLGLGTPDLPSARARVTSIARIGRKLFPAPDTLAERFGGPPRLSAQVSNYPKLWAGYATRARHGKLAALGSRDIVGRWVAGRLS